MSAALVASTVTPGRIAPDGSRTTPAMVAWANKVDGSSRTMDNTFRIRDMTATSLVS
jgi:hypothetical protein